MTLKVRLDKFKLGVFYVYVQQQKAYVWMLCTLMYSVIAMRLNVSLSSFMKGELPEVKKVQFGDGCVHGVQSSVSAQLQCEEAG